MANTDGPRGFEVNSRLGGGEPTKRRYPVDNGTATAIFIGDLVHLDTDGYAAVMAAASDDFLGVVVGIQDSDEKPVKTLAASTAGYVIVCDDPNAIFEVQTEDGGTALTIAAVGDCADAVWTHAGSTTTGKAGVELSETLAGDGNSAQFRILEKVDTPNNAWGEHYIRLLVTPNEHAYKASHVAI